MPAPEQSSPRGDSRAVGTVLRELTSRFKAAGLDTPGLDARLLLEAATGWPRESIVSAPERTLSPAQLASLSDFAIRRISHEPVSRILGRRQFWSLEFEVTPDTLDPRPDSETLIEAALDIVRQNAGQAGWLCGQPRILDIGTGTGCLLLTLLSELPHAIGTGTDISPAALAVARRNAGHLGLTTRATWVQANLVVDAIDGPFDLVVSNPPYIPSRDIARLAPEVRQFDPRLALDGGPDGLTAYRALIPGLRRIAPGCWAVLEFGAGQETAIIDLIRATEGDAVADAARLSHDLSGRPRCVAWRPQP